MGRDIEMVDDGYEEERKGGHCCLLVCISMVLLLCFGGGLLFYLDVMGAKTHLQPMLPACLGGEAEPDGGTTPAGSAPT